MYLHKQSDFLNFKQGVNPAKCLFNKSVCFSFSRTKMIENINVDKVTNPKKTCPSIVIIIFNVFIYLINISFLTTTKFCWLKVIIRILPVKIEKIICLIDKF